MDGWMDGTATTIAENGDKLSPFWATIVAVFSDYSRRFSR